jgi:hypothetical protein
VAGAAVGSAVAAGVAASMAAEQDPGTARKISKAISMAGSRPVRVVFGFPNIMSPSDIWRWLSPLYGKGGRGSPKFSERRRVVAPARRRMAEDPDCLLIPFIISTHLNSIIVTVHPETKRANP